MGLDAAQQVEEMLKERKLPPLGRIRGLAFTFSYSTDERAWAEFIAGTITGLSTSVKDGSIVTLFVDIPRLVSLDQPILSIDLRWTAGGSELTWVAFLEKSSPSEKPSVEGVLKFE